MSYSYVQCQTVEVVAVAVRPEDRAVAAVGIVGVEAEEEGSMVIEEGNVVIEAGLEGLHEEGASSTEG